jgi:hypothetical protein
MYDPIKTTELLVFGAEGSSILEYNYHIGFLVIHQNLFSMK